MKKYRKFEENYLIILRVMTQNISYLTLIKSEMFKNDYILTYIDTFEN